MLNERETKTLLALLQGAYESDATATSIQYVPAANASDHNESQFDDSKRNNDVAAGLMAIVCVYLIPTLILSPMTRFIRLLAQQKRRERGGGIQTYGDRGGQMGRAGPGTAQSMYV